jgi:hypothetical protein
VLTISGQLQYIIIREDGKEEDFSFFIDTDNTLQQ